MEPAAQSGHFATKAPVEFNTVVAAAWTKANEAFLAAERAGYGCRRDGREHDDEQWAQLGKVHAQRVKQLEEEGIIVWIDKRTIFFDIERYT